MIGRISLVGPKKVRLLFLTSTLALVTVAFLAALLPGPGVTNAGTVLTSWNPAVQCTPVLTTIEGIIGNQMSSLGGATLAGGNFRPGIPDKRSLTPPCSYGAPPNATFVEVHNVTLTFSTHNFDDCGTYTNGVFCDTYINIASQAWVSDSTCPACYMHRIHWEIDQAWKAARTAPSSPANSTTVQIDMQGFVFWDPFHLTQSGHNFSGWELHPVTAWRTSTQSPDFKIAPNPANVAVLAGQTGSSTITVSALNGFTGQVGLATSISPGTGLTCSLSATTVTLGTSGSSALSCSGSAGSYGVTVTATNLNVVHTTAVYYAVKDFNVTASATTVTVNAGVAGTSTIRIAALNGFAGVVGLATTSTSCAVAPTSVTGSGSSTLSCTFASAGIVQVTVTGTSGSLSHSAMVTYTVQDYTVTASPTSLTVNAGATGTSTIMVTALLGFSGVVGLTANSTSCTLTPISVTGSGNSTLSCTFASASTVHVVVIGTSSSLSHSITVTFTAQDFATAASPTTVTVLTGSAGTSTATITALNGFPGVVSLVTNSTSCNVTPNSVTGSGSSTISCTFVSVGVIHVTVTGTSGSLSHSAIVTYTVQDFTVTAFPTSVAVNAGTTGTSAITVTSLQGFSGIVGLTTNSTSCRVTPTTVTGSGSSTLSCTFSSATTVHVSVTGISGARSVVATVTYTVQDFTISANPTAVTVSANAAGTSAIAIMSFNGFAGVVSLATNSTSCTVMPTSVTGFGSSALSCTFASASAVHVTVTGTSASLSHSAIVTFTVQEFTTNANPTSVRVNVNEVGTSTITITAVDGFVGVVSLSADNARCTLTPTSVTGSGTSMLSCTFTSPGTVVVTVTGTSGSLSHTAAVMYQVQDFTVTTSPIVVTVNVDTTGNSTITVAQVNGFTGTVTLSSVVNATGLTCTLSSTGIAGGSGSSTLSCSGSAGNYLVTATGMSGNLIRTATVTYGIKDFTLVAGPTSVTVLAGSAGNSTITASAVNGFTGVITLTVSASGLTCSLSPASVVLGVAGNSNLSCSGGAGMYNVNVTGTSGPLSHSVNLRFAVQSDSVGGSVVPVDKLKLLSPYVGSMAIILTMFVLVAALVKRQRGKVVGLTIRVQCLRNSA